MSSSSSSSSSDPYPGCTHYEVLGIESDATPEEVQKAYLRLAKIYHPDKVPTPALKLDYTERFKRISHAAQILKDKDARAVYDAELNGRSSSSSTDKKSDTGSASSASGSSSSGAQSGTGRADSSNSKPRSEEDRDRDLEIALAFFALMLAVERAARERRERREAHGRLIVEAAENQQWSVVDALLVQEDADLNQMIRGRTTMYFAFEISNAVARCRRIMRLLDVGIGINAEVFASSGIRPVHLAVLLADYDLVVQLVHRGADTNVSNTSSANSEHFDRIVPRSGSPLGWALELILPPNANAMTPSGQLQVRRQIASHLIEHASTYGFLFWRRSILNYANADQDTPLHLAIQRHEWNLALQLLGMTGDHHVNVNVVNRASLRPMELLMRITHVRPAELQVFQRLFARLADRDSVERESSWGCTVQ